MKEKGFKKLWGNRILLDVPQVEDTKVIISEELRVSLTKESMPKYFKLKVFAVGDSITDIKEGDELLVDPSRLSQCPILNILGKDRVLVSVFDVILTW